MSFDPSAAQAIADSGSTAVTNVPSMPSAWPGLAATVPAVPSTMSTPSTPTIPVVLPTSWPSQRIAAHTPTTTPFATVDEAILAANGDWRTAATNVAQYLVANGEGLSSGEIARFLRMVDPSLRFGVGNVGGYLRDNYFAGNVGIYTDPDTGDGVVPVQVARQTEGLFPDRTPANVDVFVYHRTAALATAHDFEVYIPKPGESDGVIANRDSNPAPAQPPQVRTPATVTAKLAAKGDDVVAVKSDNRLYISRRIVDAYCALGNVIDGNTKVFVDFDKGYAHVAFEDNGGREYNIWQGTGRIAFYPGDGVTWDLGDEFSVTVDNEGIHVKLS